MTRRTSRLLLAAGAVVALAAGPSLVATPASASASRTTLVVVLTGDQQDPAAVGREMARRHGGSVGFVYEHALKGFSISVPDRAADSIARDRRVASVERDQLFRTAAQEIPSGVARAFAPGNANLGINGIDDRRVDVDIAVIDTGVDSGHPDLNVVAATNCTGGSPLRGACKDGSAPDGNGHGTHVAGSAAALDDGSGVVGMAPGARIHAVKVLSDNGSGYTSWIIAGIDWVTKNAATIEVANMSLGCECSSAAQDTAIANSVAAGVTYAVAAGNSAKDASTFSPANHPDVITVSALADFDGAPGALGASTCRDDQDDTLATFSNFGAEVEVAAPGVCILSTWPGGGYNTISGTSMASPHVAGAAGVLAASPPPAGSTAWSPGLIRSTLRSKGNLNWIDDSGDGIQERLLDVSDVAVFAPATVAGSGGGTAPPTNAAPTASFTFLCTGLTCDFDGTGSADSDGTISSYAWDFGDSTSGSGVATSHTYAAGSSYTVTLTVTDNAGAAGTSSQTVTVSSPPAGGITLSATGYKVKGIQHADLTWSGATSVDVIRNDVPEAFGVTSSPYTDKIGVKGSGSYRYQVCDSASPATCSPEVTVTF